MEQRQQDPRQAAARAFHEALDQLHETLHAEASPAAPPEVFTPSQENVSSASQPTSFDLDSFAQAVADIEQFLEQQSQGQTDAEPK